MTKKGPSEVGERLRRLRERAGISARELDKLAGTAVGLAAMLEKGTRDGSRTDTLVKYARALGATFEYLAMGIGKPPTAGAVSSAIALAKSRAA